jgi:4'-phosphopantetheinyl transferase
VLDEAELERAGRFRFEVDRRRFIRRRAFLRNVLATYLGVPDSTIAYRTSRHGRPEVATHAVTFSTSHADGLAVVAIATEGRVGVDVERLRPIPDALGLARGVLAAREAEHLRSVPLLTRSEEFLRTWTRKEAYAKALGLGLSLAFDRFDVLDDTIDGARLASIDELHGYVGAVAVTSTVPTGGAVQAHAE